MASPCADVQSADRDLWRLKHERPGIICSKGRVVLHSLERILHARELGPEETTSSARAQIAIYLRSKTGFVTQPGTSSVRADGDGDDGEEKS